MLEQKLSNYHKKVSQICRTIARWYSYVAWIMNIHNSYLFSMKGKETIMILIEAKCYITFTAVHMSHQLASGQFASLSLLLPIHEMFNSIESNFFDGNLGCRTRCFFASNIVSTSVEGLPRFATELRPVLQSASAANPRKSTSLVWFPWTLR